MIQEKDKLKEKLDDIIYFETTGKKKTLDNINKFSYYCSHYDRYLGQIKIKGITYNFRKNSVHITIDKDLIKNRVYLYVVYYNNKSFSYKNLPLASFEDILNYI